MTALAATTSGYTSLKPMAGDLLEVVSQLQSRSDPPSTEPQNSGERVLGVTRDIYVKVATQESEWEQAFHLVSENYRARGYEPADSSDLRFTPYLALPESVTFVAKHEGHVLATLSLVPDNTLLGLPMEALYKDEIEQLRVSGRRLMEVTSLADKDLNLREFTPVFVTLLKFIAQFTILQNANTWVIAINPRHRRFYSRVVGFEPFGPLRSYPTVQNHPAEAYMLDPVILKRNAPQMFNQLFGEWLPPALLKNKQIPPEVIFQFCSRSSHLKVEEASAILAHSRQIGSSRRW